MAKLFKNKYRDGTTRLQNWDYRWTGSYFVTICTSDRMHFFGEILNGKMHLSNLGTIANQLWHEIRNHSNDVELGEFVVMPNHIHGILHFTKFIESDDNPMLSKDAGLKTIGQQRFQNIGKNSLSSIVLGYKSAVTKYANRLNFEFGWQSRFYDHIINDEFAFQEISRYIKENPMNWKNDDFFIL